VQKTGIVVSVMLLASLIAIPYHLSAADSANSTDSKVNADVKPTKQTTSEMIREFNSIQAEKAKLIQAKQKALLGADAEKRKEAIDKKKIQQDELEAKQKALREQNDAARKAVLAKQQEKLDEINAIKDKTQQQINNMTQTRQQMLDAQKKTDTQVQIEKEKSELTLKQKTTKDRTLLDQQTLRNEITKKSQDAVKAVKEKRQALEDEKVANAKAMYEKQAKAVKQSMSSKTLPKPPVNKTSGN